MVCVFRELFLFFVLVLRSICISMTVDWFFLFGFFFFFDYWFCHWVCRVSMIGVIWLLVLLVFSFLFLFA